MPSIEEIQDCLNRKRLAFAGVSRSEKHFTRALFRELLRRGYDAVPVNPAASEIEGLRCYPRVQDIDPPVDWVLVATPAASAEAVVLDCAAAGVPRIWLYRATGQGAASQRAVRFCKSKGIRVIPGRCPYMYWPDSAWFHHLHGTLLKICGLWP